MDLPPIPSFPFLTRDMLKFGRSSKLEIQLATMSAVTTTVTCRIVDREGQRAFSFRNDGGGVDQSTNFTISEIPLFLALVSDDATIQQGDVYAVARLLINGQLVYTFAAGYVSRHTPVCWPPAGGTPVIPGRGGIRLIAGANPAAGAEISHTVPDGQLWHLLAMSATLVTDATVQTRQGSFVFTMPSGPTIISVAPSTQIASLTRIYSAAVFGATITSVSFGFIQMNIPRSLYLHGGTVITSSTLLLQAGDNWGVPSFLVEQLYEAEA